MFEIGLADAFFLRCFGDLAVARYHRVRGIQYDLSGERFRIVKADRRQGRVGHRNEDDLAKRGGLLDGADAGIWAGILNQLLEFFRVPRREHDRMTGFGEQRSDCAAETAGPDYADLLRAALREARACGYREGARCDASEREQCTT